MFSYDDVSIEKYKKIIGKSDIDQVIPILFDYSDYELDSMDTNEYMELVLSVQSLAKYRSRRYEYIEKLGEKLYYQNIFKLTFGEYLDLTSYIKSNDIHKLYCIFFRRTFDNGIFDSPRVEPYDFDVSFREGLFKGESIKYFFQIRYDIEKLDKVIHKNFSVLFDDGDKDINNENKEAVDKRVKAVYQHEQKIKESFSKNAWAYTVYDLAGGDITKFDKIYKTPLFTVLSTLKMQRDMDLRRNSRNVNSK